MTEIKNKKGSTQKLITKKSITKKIITKDKPVNKKNTIALKKNVEKAVIKKEIKKTINTKKTKETKKANSKTPIKKTATPIKKSTISVKKATTLVKKSTITKTSVKASTATFAEPIKLKKPIKKLTKNEVLNKIEAALKTPSKAINKNNKSLKTITSNIPIKKTVASEVKKLKTTKNVVDNPATMLLHTSIIQAIKDIKGEKIISIDLRSVDEAIADYFIICEATTFIQLKGIADNVELKVKDQCNEKIYRRNVDNASPWMILDYVNIVVHLLLPEERAFYALEEHWSNGKIQRIKD